MKITVQCSVCGHNFEKEKKKVNEAIKNGWNFYCSEECKKHKNSKLCKCAYCGKEVWKTMSEIKKSKSGNVFCSRSCATSFNNAYYKIGDSHPVKGKIIEGSLNYRRNAFIAYEHKCLICGWNEDERILEVHHIDENHNNNNINNLCLLCPICHRKISSGYYKLEENNKLIKIK